MSNALIVESPENIILPTGKKLTYEDSDAYAFIYLGGELWISKPGKVHLSVIIDYAIKNNIGINDPEFNANMRGNGKYSGRLWLNSRIISFWEYPSKKRLSNVINDLEKKLNISIGDEWKIEDRNHKGLLIPISNYQGSNFDTGVDIKNRHVKSPLLKDKGYHPNYNVDKNTNMCTAKYNDLKTRYKFTESEITENPEKVRTKNLYVDFENEDARTFAWYNNKLYVADDSCTWHYMLVPPKDAINRSDISRGGNIDRTKLTYPGRLWLNSKIISFWKYPPPNKFRSLLRQLGKHKYINQDLLSDPWLVEIILGDTDTESIQYIEDPFWYNSEFNTKLIPTNKYAGSKSRSTHELAKMHMLSPLYKGSRKVYYKTRKLPKNMSTAEYNALKTKYKFSESADLSTDDYNNTLEALAELEHDQWIEWAKNIIKSENISADRAERWKALFIPYSELSEEMKDLDRDWAKKALDIINGTK